MTVTVEISYYPLADDYSEIINRFIKEISTEEITVEVGRMSTLLTRDYDKIMTVLNRSMKQVMLDFPSVFTLKISNSCPL